MGFEDSLFSLPLVTQVAWQDFGKAKQKQKNTRGETKSPLEAVEKTEPFDKFERTLLLETLKNQ